MIVSSGQDTASALDYFSTLMRWNPNSPSRKFTAQTWDVELFGYHNMPVILGELQDKEAFSLDSGIRVLDMPIKMPDQGWAITPDVLQFYEAIQRASYHEQLINPFYDSCYCYITVDQKPVEPGKSQRRPGWHSDAYITDEQGTQLDVVPENAAYLHQMEGQLVDRTYVASDAMPTRFLPGPFPLHNVDPNDCEAVQASFDEMAQGQIPVTYPDYALLCLDPYDVHAAVANTTDETLSRTFVKIAFSLHQYNREGNTHNHLFDYEWEMIPREPGKRSHRHAAEKM